MNQQSYHKVSISEIVDDPDYANVSVRKWLQQNYSVPPIVLPIGDPVESKLKIKLGELNEDKSIVHYGEDSDLIQLSISFKIDDESEIRLTMARVGEDTFEGEFHCSYEE
jgi:hypothetical protein